MATLELPDRDHDALLQLLRLPTSQIESLKADLAAANGRYRQLVGVLGEYVQDGSAALHALIAMGLLIREERFTADDVTVALRASADNDDLSAEAVEVDDLSDFSELVELPAILQFVKAVELRNAYENILTDSRIVTDIRPVFPDGKVDRVEAAMINHTILLTYQNGEESEAQRLYVAVDLDDLEKLKAQIDRALDKEHATRALIEAAAVTRLEPTEGPENGQIERAGGDTDGS